MYSIASDRSKLVLESGLDLALHFPIWQADRHTNLRSSMWFLAHNEIEKTSTHANTYASATIAELNMSENDGCQEKGDKTTRNPSSTRSSAGVKTVVREGWSLARAKTVVRERWSLAGVKTVVREGWLFKTNPKRGRSRKLPNMDGTLDLPLSPDGVPTQSRDWVGNARQVGRVAPVTGLRTTIPTHRRDD
jgi:hypothetical protein